MWLEKLFDNVLYQVYSIHEPSETFKEKYSSKFTIVYCSSSGSFVQPLDEISLEDLVIDDGCVYMFTYHKTLPKKILSLFEQVSEKIKLPQQKTFSACLDKYYEKNIGVIFEVFPGFNQIPPLFNQSVIIKAPIKRLKFDNLSEQIVGIIEEVFSARIQEFSELTVEAWVEDFIHNPFTSYYNTCVIYPKLIDEKSLKKKKKLSSNNFIVTYDVRANNYEEESKLFAAIGEAFEKKNTWVNVYDSFNGMLSVIIKKLDEKKLQYKQLNEFAITLPYQNLKQIEMKYDLTDFI